MLSDIKVWRMDRQTSDKWSLCFILSTQGTQKQEAETFETIYYKVFPSF